MLGVIGLAWVLIQLGEILVIVLISAILANGLAPIVAAVERKRWTKRQIALSRPWALLFVYLALVLVLGLLAGIVITPLVKESAGFVAHLSTNLERIERDLARLQIQYSWLPDLAGIVRRLPQEPGRLSAYLAPTAGVAFRFLGGVATVITVLFLSFYMLAEGPTIEAGFLSLFPQQQRTQIASVLNAVGAKFGGWLRGQLLLAAIIAVAAAVGMAAIGMPAPIVLGIFAGIVEFIPMIGPVLSAIPAVLLALFQDWWKIVFTIAWYTAIQQLEGNFLVPRVMRQAVGLSPLLTILALIIGAKLLGLVGALLAVPVTAALQSVVGEVVRAFRPEDRG